jgi:5-formyltetrahydrofolate cyclo-ligase
MQEVTGLIAEPWDVPLDRVVTEDGVIECVGDEVAG